MNIENIMLNVDQSHKAILHYSTYVGIKNISALPRSSVSKESACNAGDWGLILGSGRSPG